jgi:hypothetical protein
MVRKSYAAYQRDNLASLYHDLEQNAMQDLRLNESWRWLSSCIIGRQIRVLAPFRILPLPPHPSNHQVDPPNILRVTRADLVHFVNHIITKA